MVRLILLLALLLLFGRIALAQDTDDIVMEFNGDKAIIREIFMTKEERLISKLERRLTLDYELYVNCEAFFTFVVYHVRNDVGLDTLGFEKACKQSIKDGFNRLIPFLKEQTWAEIFPKIDSISDYDIVLSLAYSYKRGGCYDTIPARVIKWKANDIMDRRRGNSIPSFGLKPIVLTQTRIHKRYAPGSHNRH